MFKILSKERLAENVVSMLVEAPLIAGKAKPGQFVILRVDEKGERIPLTVVSVDESGKAIRLIFQEVGKTTTKLGRLRPGEYISDLVGPLGRPTEVKSYGHVVVIGGGVGVAEAYPVAKALKSAGNRVTAIIGARSKDLLILEDEMREVCDSLHVCTDDGSKGRKGFVTDVLKELLEGNTPINLVYAIGPAVMMKVVADLTRPYGVHTMVSLNPIMVDGTGMCGACRVTVGGETRFVCVDGPEFDAHMVDFQELMTRQRMYLDKEKMALEKYLREGAADG
ncbi:MAG: sulfide/dihydroorotate dehydrogenase-like FAD/NAD-binding protein [Candidatus Bathyarchaeia archaeon]|nr:sulfide/dihydroorotate dehydrogenase-like FAD/NAD-binding protein [Candidatus Bathyarchaeota archaeon]